MLPLLDEDTVRAHLRWDELIAAMERALVEFSAGRVQQPVRRFLTIDRYEGFFGIMPAASETVMGIKLVTFYPGNAARGLPTHLAMIQLFAPETGEALALLDGRLITEMRTAAVSAQGLQSLKSSPYESTDAVEHVPSCAVAESRSRRCARGDVARRLQLDVQAAGLRERGRSAADVVTGSGSLATRQQRRRRSPLRQGDCGLSSR